jgi:uncharacterized OB-fold protein
MQLPDPAPDRSTRAFWDAAKRGELVLPWCLSCGRPHYYPRSQCPYCYGDRLEWREASGAARLYTWSTVRANDLPGFTELVPYIAAVVDLAEGPRAMTIVVGCAADELTPDQPLQVTFVASASGQWQLPVFEPAG